MSFRGPLPPPVDLAGYESAYPGTADRILKMAEESLRHTMEMEKLSIQAQIEAARAEALTTRRGQFCGLAIGLGALTAGVACVIFGGQIGGAMAGTLLGAGGIATLVTLFIYNRREDQKSK